MAIRRGLESGLRLASVAFFETRFPPADSLRFWRFWRECQRSGPRRRGPASAAVRDAIVQFRRNHFCIYRDEHTVEVARQIKAVLGPWFDDRSADGYLLAYDGEPSEIPGVKALFASGLRDLVEGLMRSNFAVFYAIAHRSVAQAAAPDGGYSSSLWHADGTPPSCLTAMVYLDDADEGNGAIEFGPKRLSQRVLMRSVSTWKSLGHAALVEKYREAVERHGSWHVARAPAGSVVVFSNNILHRGGLARGARSRDVMIFHLYPSMSSFDADARAMKKTAGIPGRPDF